MSLVQNVGSPSTTVNFKVGEKHAVELSEHGEGMSYRQICYFLLFPTVSHFPATIACALHLDFHDAIMCMHVCVYVLVCASSCIFFVVFLAILYMSMNNNAVQ